MMGKVKSHLGTKSFVVRQYYVVELEVKADNIGDARDAIYDDDYEYNVTTQFVSQAGGPQIVRAEIDDEVITIPAFDE
jgi:hypothetical protein